MSGIQATQLSTVLNASGDPAPDEQPGLVTNLGWTWAIVGASHASLSAILAAPFGSTAPRSLVIGINEGSAVCDVPGSYLLQVQGWPGAPGVGAAEATYTLPLAVAAAATIDPSNPINITEAAPNEIRRPARGGTIAPNPLDNNRPLYYTPDGLIRPLLLGSVDGAWELPALADADVATPVAGRVKLYYSTTAGAAVIKDSNDDVNKFVVGS